MNANRMTLLMLIAALLTGGAGWYLAKNYIQGQVDGYKNEMKSKQQMVPVVVAAVELKSGTIIGKKNAVIRKMPRDFIDKFALTPNEFNKIQGKELAHPIGKGAPILLAHTTQTKQDLFAKFLKPGFRALTIPVSSLDAISGFLRPGHFIDLLITVRGQDGMMLTKPLIQNVRVIAAGNNVIDRDSGKSYRDLTLGVPPKDAAKLIHAQKVGSLKIILRSDQDKTIIKDQITIKDLVPYKDVKKEKKPTRQVRQFEIIRGGS